MIKPPQTIEELLDYWPGNIPFKGSLISDDNSCMCAQGQVLHFLGGLTPEELHALDQKSADAKVAQLLGVSTAHAILLRLVNDEWEGSPACVIRNPEQVLGPKAQVILAFWRHLEQMTPVAGATSWEASRLVNWDASWAAAQAAAGRETAKAAWAVAGATSWEAARAAVGATHEIQGADVMRQKNQPFVFLPLFGFENPESIPHTSSQNK